MGAPFWTNEEKTYFNQVILPQSKYSTGEYVKDGGGMEFDELATVMQTELDRRGLSKRKYTGLGLFQHYYQKCSVRSEERGERESFDPSPGRNGLGGDGAEDDNESAGLRNSRNSFLGDGSEVGRYRNPPPGQHPFPATLRAPVYYADKYAQTGLTGFVAQAEEVDGAPESHSRAHGGTTQEMRDAGETEPRRQPVVNLNERLPPISAFDIRATRSSPFVFNPNNLSNNGGSSSSGVNGTREDVSEENESAMSMLSKEQQQELEVARAKYAGRGPFLRPDTLSPAPDDGSQRLFVSPQSKGRAGTPLGVPTTPIGMNDFNTAFRANASSHSSNGVAGGSTLPGRSGTEGMSFTNSARAPPSNPYMSFGAWKSASMSISNELVGKAMRAAYMEGPKSISNSGYASNSSAQSSPVVSKASENSGHPPSAQAGGFPNRPPSQPLLHAAIFPDIAQTLGYQQASAKGLLPPTHPENEHRHPSMAATASMSPGIQGGMNSQPQSSSPPVQYPFPTINDPRAAKPPAFVAPVARMTTHQAFPNSGPPPGARRFPYAPDSPTGFFSMPIPQTGAPPTPPLGFAPPPAVTQGTGRPQKTPVAPPNPRGRNSTTNSPTTPEEARKSRASSEIPSIGTGWHAPNGHLSIASTPLTGAIPASSLPGNGNGHRLLIPKPPAAKQFLDGKNVPGAGMLDLSGGVYTASPATFPPAFSQLQMQMGKEAFDMCGTGALMAAGAAETLKAKNNRKASSSAKSTTGRKASGTIKAPVARKASGAATHPKKYGQIGGASPSVVGGGATKPKAMLGPGSGPYAKMGDAESLMYPVQAPASLFTVTTVVSGGVEKEHDAGMSSGLDSVPVSPVGEGEVGISKGSEVGEVSNDQAAIAVKSVNPVSATRGGDNGKAGEVIHDQAPLSTPAIPSAQVSAALDIPNDKGTPAIDSPSEAVTSRKRSVVSLLSDSDDDDEVEVIHSVKKARVDGQGGA